MYKTLEELRSEAFALMPKLQNGTASTDEKQRVAVLVTEMRDAKARADGEALLKSLNPTSQKRIERPTLYGGHSGGGATWSKKAAGLLNQAMPNGVDGQKALVSGSIGVPNVIDPAVVRIGTVPTSILDLITVKPPVDGGNTFTFLQQTVRTNNAAPVADGALKPTSVYTLKEIEDRFRVIAHLSEPTPQRYFTDHALLTDFLAAEMEYGLLRAVETQVVSGDGTGENLTGILNTPGILTVSAVTGDLIATLRKAITNLQSSGTVPTAFALNPTDMETLDLIREGTGTGQYLLGGPGSSTDQTLWDIPRVSSSSIAAGTAIAADWSLTELVVRENATMAVDLSGDNFTHNLATMRVEGRFGLAVKRPSSFAKITLPTAG